MKPTLNVQPESVEVIAGVGIPIRTAKACIILDDKASASVMSWKDPLNKLALFVAKLNKKPVAFVNHIALPETLLMTGWEFVTVGKTLSLGERSLKVNFSLNLTRGLCEDGQTRYVGWNRMYRPEAQRFEPCGFLGYDIRPVVREDGSGDLVITVIAQRQPYWGQRLYSFVDAIGGFERLWNAE